MKLTSLDGGLRSLFRRNLSSWHWQSIESSMTGMGIPDSNYCHLGAEGWVEFKAASGLAVRVSPMQIGWLLRRSRAGGRCFVAVRRRQELFMFRGEQAADLVRPGALRDVLPLGQWDRGPARWDWEAVGTILLGE